jgi:phosphoglycolate phosphatase-like HAD superfamily hydrolase
LLRLLEHYAVAPEEALFVGDLESDEEAARRAGVAFMRAEQFFAGSPR